LAAHPYPDHLFGDLDQPAKGSSHHITQNKGLHHAYRVSPWLPKPAEPIKLLATSSSDLAVQQVKMRFSLDMGKSWREKPFEAGEWRWDTLTWGWLREWQLSFPAIAEGTELLYQVFAELPGGKRCFADNQALGEAAATLFRLRITSHNQPPAWSEDAVIYQVFVDRFNPGKDRKWLQTADLTRPFGGTLRGVIEKLDYLKDLGFNTIWLSPIFCSPSHHGYDISDYFRIEPRMGTEEDLRELLDLAHSKGLHVLLDFVANHCSNQHERFQAALAGDERALPWFKWKTFPHYEGFYNVPGMPCFNLEPGSPARAHLLEAARYWLRFGADGYRLDYANGPSRDFWVEFLQACQEVNPECWTFGEIVAPADEQITFAGSMHGTLDFLTCQALRETFATGIWSLSHLAGYLENYWADYPKAFSRPAFIDNHDMNRFFFTAEGSVSTQEAALRLLYLMPGAPIVYYGSERELSQRQSIHTADALGFDEARQEMDWVDKKERKSAKVMRDMAAFRRGNPWLSHAQWHTLELEPQKVVFNVINGPNRLLVEVRSDQNVWQVRFE
jgi:cyclomaltodextrinase